MLVKQNQGMLGVIKGVKAKILGMNIQVRNGGRVSLLYFVVKVFKRLKFIFR